MLTTDMTSKYEIQVADPRTLSRHPTKLSYFFTSLLTDKLQQKYQDHYFACMRYLKPTCPLPAQ